MKRYDVQIEVTVIGPLLTASSEPGDFGLDMIIARIDDCPYIPGTLLSGKLDQAWQEIAGAAPNLFSPDRAALLGERNENKEPLRKQLFFSDLNLAEQDMEKMRFDAVQHRVTIDKERGAAAEQHLIVMESPFAQGNDFTFIGKVIFFAPDDQGEEIIRCLDIGLRWLSQLGGMRSIGYGRVRKAGVSASSTRQTELVRPDQVATAGLQAEDNTVCLKITPQYPFCLSKPQTADNLFESDEIISGSAVLGSIITTWNNLCGSRGELAALLKDSKREELKKNFNTLRISHAFPAQENRPARPVVFPKSMVLISAEGKEKKKEDRKNEGQSSSYDVALADKPCLIRKQVPSFSIDWKEKDYGPVLADFGWPKPGKQLRVRTGIEPDTLRVAENELFSQEQVIPDKHCWLARLDLNDVAEEKQDKVLAQFCSLVSQGVFGLGKTKTPFRVECLPAQDRPGSVKPSHPEPLEGNQWIITLQSDTLMGSPEHPDVLDESSGPDQLHSMYKHAWKQLSDGNLKLVRFFASQHLSGGEWLRNTMQRGQQYRPWLLTDASSVFVLTVAPGASPEIAAQYIRQWLGHGLPLKGDVRTCYGLDREGAQPWQCCPCLRENGYGEIAVNLDVHTERYLPDQYSFIDLLPKKEEPAHV